MSDVIFNRERSFVKNMGKYHENWDCRASSKKLSSSKSSFSSICEFFSGLRLDRCTGICEAKFWARISLNSSSSEKSSFDSFEVIGWEMIFDWLDRIKSCFWSVFVEGQFSVFEGLVRFITGETEGDRE